MEGKTDLPDASEKAIGEESGLRNLSGAEKAWMARTGQRFIDNM